MNRQILIAKAGIAYGSSHSSASAETATNPSDLAEGALGIFFMDTTGTWSLVTASSPSAKTITKMPLIYLVQGVKVGNAPVIVAVEGKGLEVYLGKVYTAPVTQVIYVGYDGTLGAGITSVDSGIYTIKSVLKYKAKNPFIPRKTVSVEQIASGGTNYSISAKLADNINLSPLDTLITNGFALIAEVVSNGTKTTIANGAGMTSSGTITAAYTQGSTAVTITASVSLSAPTMVAGDFIEIAGVTYKVVSTSVTGAVLTITIDRALIGASGTTVPKMGASVTIFGIRLTGMTSGNQVEIATMDELEGVYVSYATNAKPGSGTYSEVLDAEQNAQEYRGYFHPGGTFPEPPPTYSVSGETYDMVTLTHSAIREDHSAQNNSIGFQKHTQVAIPESLDLSATFLTYLNAWAVTTPGRFDTVTV